MSNKPDLSFIPENLLPRFQYLTFDWDNEQHRFAVFIGAEQFSFFCGSRGCQTEKAATYIKHHLRFDQQAARTYQLFMQGRLSLKKNRDYPDCRRVVALLAAVTKPTAADFLHCALLDGDAGDMTHEDFCANFGYDTDSRKGLETYLQCQEYASKLRKLYTPALLEQLREALQDF